MLEAGLKFDLVAVDLRSGKSSEGDFRALNPKGYVPALKLDNGLLTENAVIMQYAADRAPDARLLPAQGTMERYRCLEWMNYVATELHKGFGPLWSDATPDSYKEYTKDNLGKRIDFVNRELSGREYLMGNQFTCADAYLFTVLSWSGHVGVELKSFANVLDFMDRVKARPKVQAALRAEGLLK
jgi:glutathione S-transferase